MLLFWSNHFCWEMKVWCLLDRFLGEMSPRSSLLWAMIVFGAQPWIPVWLWSRSVLRTLSSLFLRAKSCWDLSVVWEDDSIHFPTCVSSSLLIHFVPWNMPWLVLVVASILFGDVIVDGGGQADTNCTSLSSSSGDKSSCCTCLLSLFFKVVLCVKIVDGGGQVDDLYSTLSEEQANCKIYLIIVIF